MGGLFNAIAFAGAGYVFHMLDKNSYEKEMRRHDRAMERLSAEKEKWYEKTVEKKNKKALVQQKLLDANKDLDDAKDALHNLRVALEDLQDHEAREPKLQNYYEPSDEMKRYMDIVTGVIGSVSGFLMLPYLLGNGNSTKCQSSCLREILGVRFTSLVCDDREIHFKAKDVALALGYSDSKDATQKHVLEENKFEWCVIKVGGSPCRECIHEPVPNRAGYLPTYF